MVKCRKLWTNSWTRSTFSSCMWLYIVIDDLLKLFFASLDNFYIFSLPNRLFCSSHLKLRRLTVITTKSGSFRRVLQCQFIVTFHSCKWASRGAIILSFPLKLMVSSGGCGYYSFCKLFRILSAYQAFNWDYKNVFFRHNFPVEKHPNKCKQYQNYSVNLQAGQ